MSQRGSGYQRADNDLYETPEWVTQVIVPYLPEDFIWEPAAGNGKMVNVLRRAGFIVLDTDTTRGVDFTLEITSGDIRAIVTNPPYSIAAQFVRKALELTKPHRGFVAMLLRTDFDHAKTRADLFSNCPMFAKKIVLTRRIVWFERDGAAPSFNHAWYIWDWAHNGLPTIEYDIGKK